MPSASYLRTHACIVWRVTPYHRATSDTCRPSRTTPMTASYRCSTNVRSFDMGAASAGPSRDAEA